MNQVLELEPERFDRFRFIPETASEALYGVFLSEMKAGLGATVVGQDFDVTELVPQFHEIIDAKKGSVVSKALAHEQNWSRDEYRPLHRYLGGQALQGETPGDIEVDPAFIDNLHEQVDGLTTNFDQLQIWHDNLEQHTDILALVRSIQALQEQGGAHGEWLPLAHRLLQFVHEEPAAFTVPSEELDALYLVTFMPAGVRTLVRRAIVGNVMMNEIRQELGEELTPAEAQALAALNAYYATDTLSGDQWDQLLKRHSDNADLEALSIEIGRQSAEQLPALGTLQRLTAKGQTARVVAAWQTVRERLDNRMRQLERNSDLSRWQLQDGGHCFHNFGSFGLQYAFDTRDSYKPVFEATPELKTGGKAFILEDDPEQMDHWKRVVDAHTAYVVDEELCFAAAADLEATLDQSEAGLYLLDIQNGDDATAGIRLGQRVLDRLFERQAGEEALSPTTVIVWSASPQAAQAASDVFKQIIEAHPQGRDISYSLLSGSGRIVGDAPIKVDVRLKRWSSITDTPSVRSEEL